MMNLIKPTFLILLLFTKVTCAQSSRKSNFTVTGYYAGNTTAIDSIEVDKLTHLIFSFSHLDSNRISLGGASDTIILNKMLLLKQKNPSLKILVSLGGWGGCKTCSTVFADSKDRIEFARSVKALIDHFSLDGIDLDWEYPAIEGYPDHPYSPQDRINFTELIRALRKTLGKEQEISFAAGGFGRFIDESVEWDKVMRMVNRVNLMSYDLIGGYSTISGHHTPLYSTTFQKESTDNGVSMLIKKGVPASKIVIGAAFYARLFLVADTLNHGLNRPGIFHHGISYKNLYDSVNSGNGFIQYLDTVAAAQYAFNKDRLLFATYDDSLSVSRKSKYAIKNNLNGIMFWQLMDDKFKGGLLNAINTEMKLQ